MRDDDGNAVQNKIMAEFARRATAASGLTNQAGLEFLNQQSGPGQGVAYIQRGWDTIVEIHYDFRDTRAYPTILLGGPAVRDFEPAQGSHTQEWRTGSGTGSLGPHLEFSFRYRDGDRLRRLFTTFGDILTAWVKAQRDA